MKIPHVSCDSKAAKALLTNNRRLVTTLFLALATTVAFINPSAGNSASSPAPSYEILHSFTGNDNHGFTGDTDGANPWGPLIQAPDGNFYGTTLNGSSTATAGTGTVFKIDLTGKITILHHFLMTKGGDGQLSNGYQRTGVFQNGRIQVEECRQAHAQKKA